MNFICVICVLFLFCLCVCFIAALWSTEWKWLTSWLLFVMFIMIFLLSHLVYWDRCGTWLYRLQILAVFLTFNTLYTKKIAYLIYLYVVDINEIVKKDNVIVNEKHFPRSIDIHFLFEFKHIYCGLDWFYQLALPEAPHPRIFAILEVWPLEDCRVCQR